MLIQTIQMENEKIEEESWIISSKDICNKLHNILRFHLQNQFIVVSYIGRLLRLELML